MMRIYATVNIISAVYPTHVLSIFIQLAILSSGIKELTQISNFIYQETYSSRLSVYNSLYLIIIEKKYTTECIVLQTNLLFFTWFSIEHVIIHLVNFIALDVMCQQQPQ